MNLAAVIIETRPLPNLKQIIEAHLNFLPEYTKLYVFGSDHVDLLLSQANFKYEFFDVGRVMNEQDYNSLLTTVSFWESIQEENVLIFQHDSEILRPGIEHFYCYDYVGAPWKFQEHGGNGGLSFRKKSAMIRVIKELWPYTYSKHGNEDVFFCNAMCTEISKWNTLKNNNYELAPRRGCAKFSCETIFNLGTFGCHAIDRYLTPEQCKQIRIQYK